MSQRLRDHGRIASSMVSYATLLLTWSLLLRIFTAIMAPRLRAAAGHYPIGVDRPCASPQCDFSMFWPAGLLARAHQYARIYQPGLFWAWRRHILAPATGRIDFLYPPPTLLPAALVSFLPFQPAFIVWTLSQTIIAVLLLRWARLPWPVIVIGLLSPAALWNLELGQIGILTNTLFLTGLLMMERAPWRAGGLIGLLVFKPQAGLLAPLAMLAARAGRPLLAASAVCAGTVAIAAAVLGASVWQPFLAAGGAAARAILEAKFSIGYLQFGVSVFWMLRSFGFTLAICYGAQAFAALVSAALAVIIWRRAAGDFTAKVAVTVFLSLLVTPYGFTYDMVGYSIVLTMLARRRRWRIDLADVLFWLWPGLCPVIVMQTGLLFTPVIVALAILRSWRAAGLGFALLPRRAAVLPRAG